MAAISGVVARHIYFGPYPLALGQVFYESALTLGEEFYCRFHDVHVCFHMCFGRCAGIVNLKVRTLHSLNINDDYYVCRFVTSFSLLCL
jgi:hypothetical protein